VNCVDSTECRDLFGFGYTCQSNGFCALPSLPERCDRSTPSDYIEAADSIGNAVVIAELYDKKTYGLRQYASQLAISDFRRLYNLEDREVVLLSCNIQADEENAIDGLNKGEAVEVLSDQLHKDLGIKYFIGPNSSDASIVAYNQLTHGEGIIISPWASAQVLETIDTPQEMKSDDNPGSFWRTVASDRSQSHALSLLMKTDQTDNILIFYERSIFADNFALNLSEKLSANGISSTLIAYSSGENDITETIDRNIGNEPDLQIAFVSENVDENISFINAIGQRDNIDRVYLAYGARDEKLLEETQIHLDNRIFFVSPSLSQNNSDTHIFESFQANFVALSGAVDDSDSILSAFVYDATWMMLFGLSFALENGDLDDASLVGLGIRKMSDSSSQSIALNAQGWSSARSQFSVDKSIDIFGASGPLDYDNSTEELKAYVDLWKINSNHEFEFMFNCYDDVCESVPQEID